MKWWPLEADGGRTENAIYNVIAAQRRPAEADGGQVEAAQDMQITIVRTRMERRMGFPEVSFVFWSCCASATKCLCACVI